MTERNPAVWLQAGSHPAEDMRRMIGALAVVPGIVGATDLAVTQNGTPNMTVQVAGGRAFIAGTEGTYQGTYLVENRGTTSLNIATAHATNPRKDFVVARVQDAGYSGATNAWSLAVITGTPAAGASNPNDTVGDPTPPANSIVLARVHVPANDTTIGNAQIIDLRTARVGQQRATALGGWVICKSTTRPVTPWEGLTIYEDDTDKVLSHDGSNWVETLRLGAWEAWTPTIKWGATTHTPGAVEARFCRLAGRTIVGRIHFKVGTVSGTGSITFTPPVTPAPIANAGIVQDYMTHVGFGAAITVPGGAPSSFFANFDGTQCYMRTTAGNAAITHNSPSTWASGDEFHAQLLFEAAASA
jgi:hypothetical protein